MSVRSTIAAALTPIAMAIVSEISSRRGSELEGLLDVALQAALALRGQAGGDGDQLLGLPVEHGRLVGLLVELEVDLAEARVDHGVGAALLGGLRRPVVLFREGNVVFLVALFVAHGTLLSALKTCPAGPDASAVRGPDASRRSPATALRRPPCPRARRRRGCARAPPGPARGRRPPPSARTRSLAACGGRPSCRRTGWAGPRAAPPRPLTSTASGSKRPDLPIQNTTSLLTGHAGTSRSQRAPAAHELHVVAHGVGQAAVAAVAHEPGDRRVLGGRQRRRRRAPSETPQSTTGPEPSRARQRAGGGHVLPLEPAETAHVAAGLAVVPQVEQERVPALLVQERDLAHHLDARAVQAVHQHDRAARLRRRHPPALQRGRRPARRTPRPRRAAGTTPASGRRSRGRCT